MATVEVFDDIDVALLGRYLDNPPIKVVGPRPDGSSTVLAEGVSEQALLLAIGVHLIPVPEKKRATVLGMNAERAVVLIVVVAFLLILFRAFGII